ncbi:atrial natriuretic peptide receptor 1-like [Haliotis asinina]|uniref:atrial natriuretic peptide receptor 1-like n=1 Tax=Haliotis asinina TaxID=109174 RepID=UPI003531F016
MAWDSRSRLHASCSCPAVNLALGKAQKKYGDLIDFQVTFRNNTCNGYRIGALAADVYYNEGVTAFIGPACGDAVEMLGFMVADWNIPLITPAGSTENLGDIEQYPTITKLSPFGLFLEFTQTILELYHWSHIALMYDNSDRYSESSRMGRLFHQTFKTSIFDVTHLPLRRKRLNTAGYRFILEQGSENARVFIIHAPVDVVREIMLIAHEMGFTRGEYVFIITVTLRENVTPDVWQRGDESDEKALEAFQSVFFLALRESKTQKYERFRANVVANALENWDLDFGGDDPGDFIVGYHDAVSIYAQVLYETLKEGGDPNNGSALTRKMWNRTYLGVERNITVDENGVREADLFLLDLTKAGRVIAVGTFLGGSKTFRYTPGRTIIWPHNAGPPPDVPECGFKGLRCTFMGDMSHLTLSEVNLIGALVGTISLLILIGSTAFFVQLRYRKKKTVVDKLWWRIDAADIHIGSSSGSQESLNSKYSSLTPKSDSVPSYCGGFGLFRGYPVRLKKIDLLSIIVDETLIEEFLHIRELNFENLVRVHGAVFEAEEKYLVTEFCQKGSLTDIIGNSDVNLDAQFKFSICIDILKGLCYLHESPLKKHGRLTSSVCLVDNCFSVKIADYGPHLIFNQIKPDFKSQEFKTECLWRAPELLRARDLRGSREGDVYSFGIILQEVFSRDSPFGNETETLGIDVVLSKIKQGGNDPLRPNFDAPSSLDAMKLLMSQCWAENPKERPQLATVKKDLKDMAARFGASGNFFNNLLRRMEQYANNLEKLVDEKTHRVREEKKRTDELLHQIIPKSVANQLKLGKRVKPDSFESVTVCFTDICGFTTLSARSTPMQIVDLLNDLYSCFDDIIDGYDVYKVETIGDAYMVVSGLPVRNGDRHAPEISRMSLSLLRAIDTIKILHLPDEKLRLRVGIHSGPVCAGVVGQKMPRYCLFGDTVITASRMESHGEACKIHISVDTKNILDRCGIFIIGSRGSIDVKGLGSMNTYWLLGEKIWNR